MSSGSRWFDAPPKAVQVRAPSKAPDKDLWTRCAGCDEILFRPVLAERAEVCPRCGHHGRLGAWARIELIIDPGSWQPQDEALAPSDPLAFTDSKPYTRRLEETQRKLGVLDAFVSGSATVHGIPLELGSFDFRFMGGSMGSVVGEAVTRLFERATERRVPALVVSASGGARMQEGILSLMQMAKTSVLLAQLREQRLPFVSVLTDPSTAGVLASYASLGDVIVAEPKALVGFAGARVIRQTIGEDLPKGFQRAEFVLEKGFVDRIAHRKQMRVEVGGLLRYFWHSTRGFAPEGGVSPHAYDPNAPRSDS